MPKTVRIFKQSTAEAGVDVPFSELLRRFPRIPRLKGVDTLRYLYRQKSRRTRAWLSLMEDMNRHWSTDLGDYRGKPVTFFMRLDGKSLTELDPTPVPTIAEKVKETRRSLSILRKLQQLQKMS